MDGYSVKDAAVVLGIPERRVWELLARGVLAGAPEGPDGMIVYLQPKSAPSSVARSEATSGAGEAGTGAKVNGNGGSHELSPFRELLTEFRNLTERYGQALLALGEARGEVAALRGRVELLEARMDFRLPSAPPTTVAWEVPEFAPEPAPSAAGLEADADAATQASATEVDEGVAGEDEPAAEPMIDFLDEAVAAEGVLEEEEPITGAVEEEMVVDDGTPEVAIADEASEAAAVQGDADETIELEAAGVEALELEAAVDLAAAGAVVDAIEPDIEAEAVEPEVDAELAPEPRSRRSRGGRTATAAFAAALARAQDPTLAELPGAEETAAALAALQRDIDASRAAEEATVEAQAPAVEAEPVAEPQAVSEAEAAPEAAEVETESTPEAEGAEPETAAERPVVVEEEPAQASVPAYYSTDVVEPDWFADGDFSWLEAAQAEAMRTEAAEAAAADVEAPAPVVDDVAADLPGGEGEGPDEVSQAAIDVAEGETSVAAELAFGDHPTTDADEPDIGHDGGFEPTIESQAMAEEEARAAIQDAFEEQPGPGEATSAADTSAGVSVATAVAEPEAIPDVVDEFEAATEESEAVEEPAAVEQPIAMDESQPAEEQAEPSAADESEFEAPAEHAGETVHLQHEAEVETEAIQEAFEEPMPAPGWSGDASAVAEPVTTDEPPPSSDDEPRTMAAATGAAVVDAPKVRGPEEFIAPPRPQMTTPTSPTSTTPRKAASGEEELMWLGDEFEAANLEVAAEGWRSPGATPAPSVAPTPVLELSDSELAQLAEDEGWDREEVEAIRRLLGRPSDSPSSATAPPETPGEAEGSDPSGPRSSSAARSDAVAPPGGGAPQPRSPDPSGRSSAASSDDPNDPEWLEGRSGAAAEAYRRLRKLFPS